MQPADIRVDPWVWIPLPSRRGRVLPTIVVAAVAAAAGYGLGRHSDKVDVAPPQKTVAASPISQPVAVNSEAKARGEKPDLALKSGVTQTRPEAPPVVLLNPGTADSKSVQDRAPTRVSRAVPGRAGGEETPRSDVGKPRDERAAGSRNSMRDYHDLRDYMLGQ